MFNGPLYENHQIVPEQLLSDSATNAFEFYVQYVSISIQYVWAHEDLLLTI